MLPPADEPEEGAAVEPEEGAALLNPDAMTLPQLRVELARRGRVVPQRATVDKLAQLLREAREEEAEDAVTAASSSRRRAPRLRAAAAEEVEEGVAISALPLRQGRRHGVGVARRQRQATVESEGED